MFARIMTRGAEQARDNKTISIEATHLKAHPRASSLRLKKGGDYRLIGLTKGGIKTKLHAITDTSGRSIRRPIRLFITAGQVRDYAGAAALMSALPEAEWLLADRGQDAGWFRQALVDKGAKPCIAGRKLRKKPVNYDRRRDKRRNRPSRDIAAQCTAGP